MSETRRRHNQRPSYICTYLSLSLFTSVVAFFLARSWFFPSSPLHHPIDFGSDLDTTIATEMQGKKHVGYFVSHSLLLRTPRRPATDSAAGELVGLTLHCMQLTFRGIYDRKFPPQKIPQQHLTHINYAFANVNKDSGEVVLSDKWADVEVS